MGARKGVAEISFFSITAWAASCSFANQPSDPAAPGKQGPAISGQGGAATATAGTGGGTAGVGGGGGAEPTCSDGAKNGDETDVDCGAKCPACADDKNCKQTADCKSAICKDGKCLAFDCGDMSKNGSETDVDCGGPNCKKCGVQKKCSQPSDCTTGKCAMGVCDSLKLSFGTPATYPVGSSCRAIALGDFNGDKKLDLVTSNYSSHSVSVLLNSGNGTFGAAISTTLPGMFYPWAVTAGQLNGDKDQILDLAVTSNSNNMVMALIGKGDGSFQLGTSYPAGSTPRGVVAADFNKDTKIDLAVSAYSSSAVYVMTGKGDGTFSTTPQTYPVGSSPWGIATGDFNGDNVSDLAVTNYGTNSISLLINGGTGTFGVSTSYTTGNNPSPIVLSDFDLDNKLDVAVSNYSDPSISVMLGTGDGKLGNPSNLPLMNNGRALGAADFDADGLPDVVFANYSGGSDMIVFLNQGAGTFKPGASFYANGSYVYGLVTGDFNGDTLSDVALVNYNAGSVSVILNTSK